MEQKYCDGVEEVSITAGVVRVDFFHFTSGAKGKDGRPPREISHRVCLSPEAFIQSFTALEQVVKQLQEKGLLQRRDGQPESAAPAKPAPAKGKSPNF